MDSEKLSLTLFDILGYLLPGFVCVFCFSLFEATILSSGFFNLTAIGENFFFFTIAAYFLGHVCHILATLLKERFYKLFSGKENHLSQLLYDHFRKSILSTFDIKLPNEGDKLSTLENYLLADSYVIASGCSDERSSLLVREGFFKSSMISFALMAIISWMSLFFGGLKIQTELGKLIPIGITATVVLAFLSTLVFLLFRDRFIFYNRIKLNNTALLFLACREKNNATK